MIETKKSSIARVQGGVDLPVLNRLLHLATESDPELAAHIESAVAFAQRTGNPDFSELNSAVEQLLKLHMQGRRDAGFAHCDLTDADDDPLFLRPTVMQALRKVAGAPQAIVLITGLRRSVCPPGRYFTSKRQRNYHHAQGFIEQLAAKYSSKRTRLRLVFV